MTTTAIRRSHAGLPAMLLAFVPVLVAGCACKRSADSTNEPALPGVERPAPGMSSQRPRQPSPGPTGAAKTRPLRTYVAGESIERRNRWVAPPFLADGSLNARGGGDARNDDEEYGWMVPFADRLGLRAPDLQVQFVGTDTWLSAEDEPYSGTYPAGPPGKTSAISGTSIPSWLEQRREELERKTFCYDLALAARGGNDFGNDDDANFKTSLQELIVLLADGSSCRPNPVIVVTGHMPDDQRDAGGPSDAEYARTQTHRYSERVRQAVDEAKRARPSLRVHFVDLYTPFLRNTATTAFPSEVWARGGAPDFGKIGRKEDRMHVRRLASIYAGEIAADGLDLAELRGD